MKTSLADISKVFQDYLRNEKPAAGASCPALERLVLCVLGEVPGKERAEIIGHAGDCAACAAALKQVLVLSAETDKAAAELEAYSGHRKPGRFKKKGLLWAQPIMKPAAAVLAGIFVLAVLIVTIPGLLDRSGTRGGMEMRIALISPVKGEATRDSLEFKWQGPTGAGRYTVELFDKWFRLVWRSGRVMGTEIRLPAEAAGRIVPGETYYWMVTANMDGRAEIKSRLAEFSVLQ